MNLRVEFDPATAAKVAGFFETSGMVKAAALLWQALSLAEPYDLPTRRHAADAMYDYFQAKYALGSVERSRLLLSILTQSFPTPKLSAAYFDNLQRLLQTRPRRATPGQIVLGLGTGRCGSTTLTAAMAALGDACATHENPPLINWDPCEEQVSFHIKRLKTMAEHYALVFDASHWWLNVAERVMAECEGTRVIAMVRDTASCIRSFIAVKGNGRGSVNHWALPNNGIWTTTHGDPTYPCYEIPLGLHADPDAARAAQIERFVRSYNEALMTLANRHPDRVLVVRTEELSSESTSEQIAAFVKLPMRIPFNALNVGNTVDSDKMLYVL